MQSYSSDIAAADALKEKTAVIRKAIAKVIVGQDDVVEKLIIAILCNGHTLLVGVPGLAKTLLVKTIADVLDLSFKRIQFTPDLMPSDITGAEILNEHLPTSSWPMRSTVHHPKHRLHCWKQCRNAV